MAKQAGLHQIRGKVGEHSYYSQTGVVGGLIRSINQGLSEKVKTAAAFANTRLNNAEFGQAGRIAGVLARYIEPKYRPMILPFSQSKMAQQILEVIKRDTVNPWGQRNINDPDGVAMAPILSSVAKNDYSDWGISFSPATGEPGGEVDLVYSEQFEQKLAAIGAVDAEIRVYLVNSVIGKFNTFTNKYAMSYARANVALNTIASASGSETFVVNFPAAQDPAAPWEDNMLVVVIVLPRRQVNGNDYILQEHCTFRAFDKATVLTD